MKAVIPAAGFGTRFLPVSKAVPKEMMPLGDRPVIGCVVEEAVSAGFDEILIVLARGKEAIIEYFTPDPALERHLEASGKHEALAAVRSIARGARIHYIYQPEMRGLGDAVALARDFVCGSGSFAVLLGDTVMHGGSPLPAMADAWKERGLGSVALEPCPEDRVSRYGIAGGRAVEPGTFELSCIVEKPAPADAPRLTDTSGNQLPFHAFAARYLFPEKIFDFLASAKPGRNGEIQLTDAMDGLRAEAGLLGVTWGGRRLDIGNPRGLIEAAAVMDSGAGEASDH